MKVEILNHSFVEQLTVKINKEILSYILSHLSSIFKSYFIVIVYKHTCNSQSMIKSYQQQFKDDIQLLNTKICDFKDSNGNGLTQQEEKLVADLVMISIHPNEQKEQELRKQVLQLLKQQDLKRIQSAAEYLLARYYNSYSKGQETNTISASIQNATQKVSNFFTWLGNKIKQLKTKKN